MPVKPREVTQLAKRDCSVTRPDTFINYILKVREIALPSIPRTCIISHSQGILDQARQSLPYHVIDLGARRPVELFLFGDTDKPDFAMVASPLGAPMIAVLVEELMALGFEQFISVGSAGHPAGPDGPQLAPGDLILVDGALVYEGTSHHYLPGQAASSPDKALRDKLQVALQNHQLTYRAGLVATTDAFYRESERFLEEILNRGAISIDMEVSALFTVATFHGCQAAALLYISDVVQYGDNRWKVAFVDDQVNTTEDHLLDIMLDVMRTE